MLSNLQDRAKEWKNTVDYEDFMKFASKDVSKATLKSLGCNFRNLATCMYYYRSLTIFDSSTISMTLMAVTQKQRKKLK